MLVKQLRRLIFPVCLHTFCSWTTWNPCSPCCVLLSLTLPSHSTTHLYPLRPAGVIWRQHRQVPSRWLPACDKHQRRKRQEQAHARGLGSLWCHGQRQGAGGGHGGHKLPRQQPHGESLSTQRSDGCELGMLVSQCHNGYVPHLLCLPHAPNDALTVPPSPLPPSPSHPPLSPLFLPFSPLPLPPSPLHSSRCLPAMTSSRTCWVPCWPRARAACWQQTSSSRSPTQHLGTQSPHSAAQTSTSRATAGYCSTTSPATQRHPASTGCHRTAPRVSRCR